MISFELKFKYNHVSLQSLIKRLQFFMERRKKGSRLYTQHKIIIFLGLC